MIDITAEQRAYVVGAILDWTAVCLDDLVPLGGFALACMQEDVRRGRLVRKFRDRGAIYFHLTPAGRAALESEAKYA